MAKVDIHREKHTDTEKAERIFSKILVDDEIEKFRDFVASDYGRMIKENKRKYNYYLKNRERDLAIISLVLGSGLRVSETVSIDIDKVDWNNQHVLIRRKGGKYDKMVFSDVALADLLEYRKVRDITYPAAKSEKALFLSLPSGNGVSARLTKNSVQKMVDKYAEAFGNSPFCIFKQILGLSRLT
ncbi:tyrosine-type recombinase/integrase [Lederbergia sp. NSJ-179]|uniref:tyrosine-type recombinase/integrase n=1 Tax=Lederbergia sp. NSJ-179 TaxID=2931402 RepID=UPI001FD27FB6|nr:tyrosine-type recombinase/integrase [Lederbergia sp. NSJ-179]MCJ7843675.1 tyrosine-type recombinase/integrase [Lederbergia sp. NSJ-179]